MINNKKKNMKNYSILIVTFFFFLIFFQEKISAENISSKDFISNQKQNESLSIVIEPLYLYTTEVLDWAFTLSSDDNYVQTTYKTLSFDWAPGFRVSCGGSFKQNKWDTKVSYSWFKTKASDQTTGSVTPAFLSSRLSILEPFNTGKVSLYLYYNMFDWDLGRNILISKNLILRPTIGLRGGWIDQNIYSDWTKPFLFDLFVITASENLKQRFKAGGPKVGLRGKWLLKNGVKNAFSLIGMFDIYYLWGHWSIQDEFTDIFDTKIFIKTSNRNFGSFVLSGFMGFGWDYNFTYKSHFHLNIGYEIEDWLNHLQIFSDASGSQNNELILQGIKVGLNLGF